MNNNNHESGEDINIESIDPDSNHNSSEKEEEEKEQDNKKGVKKARKQSAKKLPQGITQNMLKKYVVYYQEWLDTSHTRQREFFKVEKHPKLDKPWCSTKSGKVSIQDKLTQANKMVEELDKP